MGLFSMLFGDSYSELPETRKALRDADRRDPHMRERSREAARMLRKNSQVDHRADADRRDHGWLRW